METDVKTIEQVLAETGCYIGPTVGVSMLPMLKNRRDTIVVQKKTQRLQPLDVALYKRGDAYVLHRVLEGSTAAIAFAAIIVTATNACPRKTFSAY